MPTLRMSKIDKQFFGKMANEQVDFTLEQGEIHALLGENGAGKTTLMNILYGIYQADSGCIELDGKPVSIKSPKDAIALQIGMVHQHFTLVPTLTVRQNITLGLKSKGYPFVNAKELDRSIRTLSERYNLTVDPAALVGSLSVGQQQRVEIMKVLYRNARLIILDEPTAVLTPQEVESLFIVLRRLREEEHSVIIITHHIDEVLAITDRVTVLRAARNAGHVVTRETSEEELSSLMIGRKLQKIERKPLPFSFASKGLQLDSIQSKNGPLGPLSLSIPAGSIVGIAGVDGNGQKALAEVIMGIRDIESGTITLDGKPLQHLSVKERKALGIGYISDDRLKDGLVLDMDVRDNFLLSSYSKREYTSHALIDTKRVQQATEQAVSSYAIKTASLSTPVRYLSGGNQQKLIVARELGDQPKVVVACQPTRGLDIGSTEEVHSILLDLRSQGCSVLLISSDLDEILTLSDKIAVIYQGTIMDVLDHDKVDMTHLGLLMAGSKTRRSV